MRFSVTVENAPMYLARLDVALARLQESVTPEEFSCMMDVAADRAEALFHDVHPLDAEKRARIALYEWIENDQKITVSLAHRVKRAILNVGAFCLVDGLARAWDVRRSASNRRGSPNFFPDSPARLRDAGAAASAAQARQSHARVAV